MRPSGNDVGGLRKKNLRSRAKTGKIISIIFSFAFNATLTVLVKPEKFDRRAVACGDSRLWACCLLRYPPGHSQGLTRSADGSIALFVSACANQPGKRAYGENGDMTKQQKQLFAELYREYAAHSRALTAEHVNRIDAACSEARAYAKVPETIDQKTVREFVMPVCNKVATASGAPDAIWARRHISRTESVFIPLLKKVFAVSAASESITQEQFCEWRKEFFQCAGYRANQTFNRLVFPCFPKQFCSVVSPARLKRACDRLRAEGLMQATSVDMKSDAAWFDLCEVIVPLVKKGLEDFNLPTQVSFIAAIADGASKVGDGQPWTPPITVKGGRSGFYRIKVGK